MTYRDIDKDFIIEELRNELKKYKNKKNNRKMTRVAKCSIASLLSYVLAIAIYRFCDHSPFWKIHIILFGISFLVNGVIAYIHIMDDSFSIFKDDMW